MKLKHSNVKRGVRIAAGSIVTAALVLGLGMTGLAQSAQSASAKGLEGTWLVKVTLRICATNAPLGTFDSLVTFHRGGTLSESAKAPVFAIGQRSPGHGNWSADGHHTYSQRIVNLINFGTSPSQASPGFLEGWATVTHTLTLIDADHATSSGTNEFYATDGTLYRTGCSTAEATRFE